VLRVKYSDPSKILKAITLHLKSINSKCLSIDEAAKREIIESCFKLLYKVGIFIFKLLEYCEIVSTTIKYYF